MFFLYYFFYGTSYAKVPWVYNSEVNSFGWRTRGAAAATATNWMGGFIVTQFTKVGVDHLNWGFYLRKLRPLVVPRISSPFPNISEDKNGQSTDTELSATVFAIICFVFFPVVFAIYPETSRRTLEDMDQIFIQNPSVFVFGKKDMTQRERPQAFVDAENERIAEAESSAVGKEAINTASHVEEA